MPLSCVPRRPLAVGRVRRGSLRFEYASKMGKEVVKLEGQAEHGADVSFKRFASWRWRKVPSVTAYRSFLVQHHSDGRHNTPQQTRATNIPFYFEINAPESAYSFPSFAQMHHPRCVQNPHLMRRDTTISPSLEASRFSNPSQLL